jgi:hypothetical protein
MPVMQTLKQIAKRNAFVYSLLKPILDTWRAKREGWRARKEIREWINQGKPVPPPHAFKEQTVKEYASKYSTRVLVEAGTYLGQMVMRQDIILRE